MPEVTITLTIQIPEGAAVRVVTDEVAVPTLDEDRGARRDAIEWMEASTPAPQQGLIRLLMERLDDEFGLVGSKPSTGSRPYLNFYPEARYGSSRVGAITLTTGRFYAVLDPALATEFPEAEPAEGKYLTCYLREEKDVELATMLMRRALAERGWMS